MRDRSFVAVFKYIVGNLTVIKIIFFILNILTVTKVVLNIIIVSILPLLILFSVGVKGVHHLKRVVPMTELTSICILVSAWIGWAKMLSDWGYSLYIALILAISCGENTKIEV